jgi:Mlc titration factor MtfA (ptsG expression regulator)
MAGYETFLARPSATSGIVPSRDPAPPTAAGVVIQQFARWRRNRAATKAVARYPEAAWEHAWAGLPLLGGLRPTQAGELRALAALFLERKAIEEVQGVRLAVPERLTIALQACLPILNLGLGWYRGWYAVIVYPREFVPERERVDADGVVWIESEVKSGEAWEQGPVILSWADVESGTERDGYNVVIHELAHKLDMRNGDANGHPPLHAGMSDVAWARDLGTAYADLSRRVDRGEETRIDPYGAESPGEFFAVCSEAFFELPHLLRDEYPGTYAQLAAFYRQDPAQRLEPI